MNIRSVIRLVCLWFIFISFVQAQQQSQQSPVVPEFFSFDHVQDLVWANDQFVAVGKNGLVMTSPDGMTWTTHRWRSADDLSVVTWDGHQYLAAGKVGLLLSSPDGMTWKESYSAQLQEWIPIRLRFLDDHFYLVGLKHLFKEQNLATALFSSENGVDWSLVENTPANTVDIASGNGQQVIVSRNGSAYRLNTQGEWQQTILKDWGDKYRGGRDNSIVWNGLQYVALVDGLGSGSVLATSVDGLNWNIKNFSLQFNAINWTGRTFIAAGKVDVATLDPKGEWNFTEIRVQGSSIGPMIAMASANGATLITSYSGYPGPPKLLLSIDGQRWLGLQNNDRLPPIGQSVTYNLTPADLIQKDEKTELTEEERNLDRFTMLFGFALSGGPLLYLLLQIIAIWRTRGWWRFAALLPFITAIPLGWIIGAGYRIIGDEAQVAIGLIIIHPFLIVYLMIFIFVHWLSLKSE